MSTFLTCYAVNLNSPLQVESFIEKTLLENKKDLSKIFHIEFLPDYDIMKAEFNSKNESEIHVSGLYELKANLMGLSFHLDLKGLMVFGEKYEEFKIQDVFIMGGEFVDSHATIRTEALEFETNKKTITDILKDNLMIDDFIIMLQHGLSHNLVNNVMDAFHKHANEQQSA